MSDFAGEPFGALDLEVIAPNEDTVVPSLEGPDVGSVIFQFGSTATATALLVTLGLSLLIMWRKKAVKVLSKNEEAEEFFDVFSYEQYAEQRKQDLKPDKKD